MRFALFVSAVATASLISGACGGTSPSAPSPSTTPAPASSSSSQVTVNIIGSSGPGSFAPNPVSVAVGSTVAWRNSDSARHHIVLDTGTDVGNLSPGATSQAITVTSGSTVGFHCTIHPSMVGTINGSTPSSPTAPNPGY